MMQTEALLALVVEALEDIKGTEIQVLDVGDLTTMTDFMVICTGRSDRQVKSLAENVIVTAKENGVKPLSLAGMQEGEWVLIDLNAVLVHVMQHNVRDFYQIEKLWSTPTSIEQSNEK